jgi:hypothetical protein
LNGIAEGYVVMVKLLYKEGVGVNSEDSMTAVNRHEEVVSNV